MKLLKQTSDYNCGVYALHHLLYLNGFHINPIILEQQLGTDKDNGTSHKQIIEWLNRYGPTNISYGYGGSIYSHRLITPILVNYQYCDEDGCDGHYGVIINITWDDVVLYNPATGELETMDKNYFESVWYSDRYGKRFYLRIH